MVPLHCGVRLRLSRAVGTAASHSRDLRILISGKARASRKPVRRHYISHELLLVICTTMILNHSPEYPLTSVSSSEHWGPAVHASPPPFPPYAQSVLSEAARALTRLPTHHRRACLDQLVLFGAINLLHRPKRTIMTGASETAPQPLIFPRPMPRRRCAHFDLSFSIPGP